MHDNSKYIIKYDSIIPQMKKQKAAIYCA